MLAVALLGLLGSLGHCVGMCSAILVLYNRTETFQRSKWAWPLAHLGRIVTYSILGLISGAMGQLLWAYTLKLPVIQGGLSLALAAMAFYLALSFAALVPPIEHSLAALTRRWGQTMGAITSSSRLSPFLAGMVWGLLPCGLVLTALLTTMTAPSAMHGSLWMVVFGLSTMPSLLIVRWLVDRIPSRLWMRSLASMVMALFGMQLALRGFTSLGWFNHLMLGKIMLW